MDELIEDIEDKGALPFKATPMADMGMSWDGGKQMSMCQDAADYKAICAWVDSEGDPAVQSSYKLPHHMAMGDHPVVWKGVTAAMGALMGARGGVDIPDADKKAVYNHLSKHYDQFGQTAPEMKAISEDIVTREVGEKVNINALFESGETKDLGSGVLEAIVNTGQSDRQGESINIDGVDLSNYKQNSIVLYGHDYGSLPIGKAISTRKYGGQIIAKFQLAVEEYPFAATVYNLIKGGYLNAVSIGVIVKEWSSDFTQILKSEMVEFSVVPVPADKGALITRALGKSENEFKDEYKDFVRKSLIEKSSIDEVETHIKNLESLVALLKETHKDSQNEAAPEKVKTIRKIVLAKTAGQLVKESQSTLHVLRVTLK